MKLQVIKQYASFLSQPLTYFSPVSASNMAEHIAAIHLQAV